MVSGVGACNGLITVWLNVPSFVTTLAMNFILFGLVLIYSDQTQATPIPLSSSTSTGHVSFASQLMGVWLWSEILWVVAITIVVHVMLTRTRFGVRIIATGGNLLGAAEAGVPVRRVKVWCFMICSFIAGLVGIVDAVKYGSLDPGNFGVDYILYAVGACVIGGTALTGGRGTVIGAFDRRDPDRHPRGRAHADRGQHERLLRVGRRGDHLRDGAERPVRPTHRPLEGRMSARPADPAPPAPASGERALEVRGVTKRFGALVVLRGIDLELRQGEVLGLVGDNGAGKSTLVKILSGLYTQDGGELRVGGERVHFHSVEDARAHGIETVYQDLALIPQLPVYLNLFLNHELTTLGRLRFLDKRAMRKLARQYLDEIHVRVPSIDAEADQLSGGQRQAIAVARAVRAAPKILLLDEPLAAMGARESRLIIDLVKDLASSGRVSIIVIDHNYAHLFELCDRINVMQGGRITIDQPVHETSLEELTELMISSFRSQLEEVSGDGA